MNFARTVRAILLSGLVGSATLAADEAKFFRAVNLGGPALPIDGQT